MEDNQKQSLTQEELKEIKAEEGNMGSYKAKQTKKVYSPPVIPKKPKADYTLAGVVFVFYSIIFFIVFLIVRYT